MDYSDQIFRIKRKLPLAAKADPGRVVFGAKSHNYRIGPPAREQDVQSFESRYSFQFPSCFRAFVTQVGNGGAKPKHAAAGPFYGINSLNDSAAHVSAQILKQPSLLQPEMTEAEWMEMDAAAEDIEDYDDDLLWRGLWPLGTQGCTYDHALILNGPERGRVVNLNGDSRRAIFTFENNFLDWYERWLDEVISGDLLQDGPCWFGYTMAGDADHLMRVFRAAKNDVVRMNALEGLEKLMKASDLSCSELLELCGAENTEIRHQALRGLTKFSCSLAEPALMRHISGDDQDCLAACSSIYVYAKDQSIQFFEDLTRRLPQIHSDETFRFACYLLVASALDFSEHLRPLCSHPTTEFRVSALYSLGKLKQKENLLDIFIAGLDDPVPRVVHTTLQAMPASRDNQVLDAFSRIIDRYTTDEHYVLTNLEHRLREAGFHSIASFKRARSEVIATEEGDVSAEEGEIVSESGVLATWFQRIKKWLKM